MSFGEQVRATLNTFRWTRFVVARLLEFDVWLFRTFSSRSLAATPEHLEPTSFFGRLRAVVRGRWFDPGVFLGPQGIYTGQRLDDLQLTARRLDIASATGWSGSLINRQWTLLNSLYRNITHAAHDVHTLTSSLRARERFYALITQQIDRRALIAYLNYYNRDSLQNHQ